MAAGLGQGPAFVNNTPRATICPSEPRHMHADGAAAFEQALTQTKAAAASPCPGRRCLCMHAADCSYACAIPTGRLQPSMNLSHAVSTVLAECYSRRCGLLDVATAPTAVAAADAAVGEGGFPALPLPAPGDADSAAAAPTASSHTPGGQRLLPAVQAGQQPADAQELELLLQKAAAVAQAAGLSGAEASGGGGSGGADGACATCALT
jgi:hypothetical protein